MGSDYIIAVDVGGTNIKSGLVSVFDPQLYFARRYFSKSVLDANAEANAIVDFLAGIIDSGLKKSEELGVKVIGAAFSVPGPFDFSKGVCFIEAGQNKFKSLYSINLRSQLGDRLGLGADFAIKFYNDAEMFLAGESHFGEARGFNKVIGITLGTGIGSAFMADGELIHQGPGVPVGGSVYNVPFEGGILENRVSRRAILDNYKRLSKGLEGDVDVEDIALRAFEGNKIALDVFELLDKSLCGALSPVLKDFGANCVVFGGQISKSFALFSRHMQQRLYAVSSLKKIVPSLLWDLAPIMGLAVTFGTSYESPSGEQITGKGV